MIRYLCVILGTALLSIAVFVPDVGAQNYYQHQPQFQPFNVYHPPHNACPPQKIVSGYQHGIAYAPVHVDGYPVPVQAYNAPYYYSIGETYREKAYLRDVIREELRSIIGTASGSSATSYGSSSTGYGGTAASTRNPSPSVGKPNAQKPIPTPTSRGLEPDDVTPADLQQKVLAAYQGRANCVKCHGTGASPKGNFRLVLEDNAGGLKLVKYDSPMRWKIYGMASVGIMPPDAAEDASKAMETNHLSNMLQYAALRD